MSESLQLDRVDRTLINILQKDFPVCERPFLKVADMIGCEEQDVIERIERLLDDGILTRFGPMFHAARLGGDLSLCAMKVPPERFDEVNDAVNAHEQVAHNYEREHAMNMWFVLATETPGQIEETLSSIESATGLRVYNMPKLREFYVGLYFPV